MCNVFTALRFVPPHGGGMEDKLMYKRIIGLLTALCMCTCTFVQAADISDSEALPAKETVIEEVTETEANDFVEQTDDSDKEKEEQNSEQEPEGESKTEEKITKTDNENASESSEAEENKKAEENKDGEQESYAANYENEAVLLSAENVEFGEIIDIDLSETVTYMLRGKSSNIIVNLVDKNYNVKKLSSKSDYLTFTSYSPSIVSVTDSGASKGRITGKKYGSSTIEVTYDDGSISVTKKIIATCYQSEQFYSKSEGNIIADPFGYTSKTVYARGHSQIASKPHPEAMTIWFFDDMTKKNKLVGFQGWYNINILRNSEEYYIEEPDSGRAKDYTYEKYTIKRTYGWHQANIIRYTDPSNVNQTIASAYLDGEMIFCGTQPHDSGYWQAFENTVSKDRFTMLVNNWAYSGEGTYSLESRAEIPTPSKGTVDPYDEDGNKRTLSFDFTNEVTSARAEKNIILKKGSITEVANGGGTVVDAAITVDGKRVTVTPKFPLAYNTAYAIKVNKTLLAKDADLGRPMMLATDYVIGFKTCEDKFTISDMKLNGKTYSVKVKNNTESGAALYAVMSTFDSDGLIVETLAKKTEITALTESTFEITAEADFAKAELYVWDGVSGENIKSLERVITNTRAAGDTVENGEESFVNVRLEDETDTLYVSGFNHNGIADIPVTVRVIKPTEDFAQSYMDIAKADEKSFSGIYYRCEEITTDKNGKFSYSFKIKGLNGLYRIIINMPDGEVFDKEFNFTSIDLINSAMDLLKGSDESTIENNFLEVKNKLDMTDKRFDSLANKQFIYNYMLETIKEAEKSDTDELVFDLETARKTFKIALEYMYNAENPSGLKQWLSGEESGWTLKDTIAHNTFMDMSDAKVSTVANRIRSAKNMKEYKDGFVDEVVITELKLIGNKNIVVTTFKKFDEYIHTDFSKYNKLTESRKDSVNMSFLNSVGSENSISEIKGLFEKLAADELTKQNNSGNSSDTNKPGSGSSGSSGSGKDSGISIIIKNEDIKPITVPDWYTDPKTVEAFSDLDKAEWAKESINALYAQGIINGRGDGMFAPNDSVTREEIAKMLVTALKLEATDGETPEFSDVDKNSWYYDYVKIAYQHGIIAGMGDNRFGVGEYATREAVATMICRAADAKGIYLDDVITIYPFDDDQSISDWAKESVQILRESMIISGMYENTFVPKNNITRAETAKIVYGLLQYK